MTLMMPGQCGHFAELCQSLLHPAYWATARKSEVANLRRNSVCPFTAGAVNLNLRIQYL